MSVIEMAKTRFFIWVKKIVQNVFTATVDYQIGIVTIVRGLNTRNGFHCASCC